MFCNYDAKPSLPEGERICVAELMLTHLDESVPVENMYSLSVWPCVTHGTTIIATMSNNFCRCFCMTKRVCQ